MLRENGEAGEIGTDGKALGHDPETGLDVTLRTGRFGPYVQLGEQGEDKKKSPSAPSLPQGWEPGAVDLEQGAGAAWRLPRDVGIHPETGKPITAGIGRYGPFVHAQTAPSPISTRPRRSSPSASTAPSR